MPPANPNRTIGKTTKVAAAAQPLSRVSGRVATAAGASVPGLIVSAHVAELHATGNGSRRGNTLKVGKRLGSAITDQNGHFEIVYDALPVRDVVRAKLVVSISAPETPGTKPIVLHAAEPRSQPGRNETYLIQLDASKLEKAGVRVGPLGPAAPHVKDVTEAARAASKRSLELREADRQLASERVARERALRVAAKINESAAAFVARLPGRANRAGQRFAEPDKIEAATKTAAEDLASRISSNGQPGSGLRLRAQIALTDKQIKNLPGTENGFPAAIAAKDIEPLLRAVSENEETPEALVREDPVERACRDNTLSAGPCTHHHRHVGPTTPPRNTTAPAHADENSPDSPELVSSEDGSPDAIKRYVARLVSAIEPPENGLQPYLAGDEPQSMTPRNSVEQVVDRVQTWMDRAQLRGGPADLPSYHDFHHLQIAFEPVWIEAFDTTLEDKVCDLYRQIVELGGDPSKTSHTSLISEALLLEQAHFSEPPPEVLAQFEVTTAQWRALTREEQNKLIDLAEKLAEPPPSGFAGISARIARQTYRVAGQFIIAAATARIREHSDSYSRLHWLLEELERRLREPYAFTVFAASRDQRSVNFGVLATYRQKWDPQAYQAGRLVATIPLAPKETRRFRKKLTTKRSRAEKEVDNNLRSARRETSELYRAESEIIAKALGKTNFSMNVSEKASASVPEIMSAEGSYTTSFSKETATESSEVKKAFHEAVLKATEEYKRERTLEVNTAESTEAESEESGEITNPNDELPVTFVFYELQKRYRVSEHIHRVRPVVLVAQEVPAPHEIDEAWLVAHDWILNRVLLDDSFRPALSMLSTRIVGDEYALEEMRKNVEQLRATVETVRGELVAMREQVGRRYEALERLIQSRADAVAADSGDGGILGGIADFIGGGGMTGMVVDAIFGGGGSSDTPESLRIREDAAKDAHERVAREEKEIRARLEREVTALQAATDAYTKALSEHLNRKEQIARLRVHVKQNILYYMQAIWSHEPPDQRFFRLHKVKVPKLIGKRTYTLDGPPGGKGGIVSAGITIEIPGPNVGQVDLGEVADLDTPLGYKGNYMIFPLKKSNDLTTFMMAPYLVAPGLARDPDPYGEWTLDEFEEYVCCLRSRFPERFEAEKQELQAAYERILTAPRRTVDDVIVPTGSLFIEALPGQHPILEEFKLRHREMDVLKVRAEVRDAELENLRAAARLFAGERGDPDIDKMVVIEGKPNGGVLVPPGDV